MFFHDMPTIDNKSSDMLNTNQVLCIFVRQIKVYIPFKVLEWCAWQLYGATLNIILHQHLTHSPIQCTFVVCLRRKKSENID